jgi:hypothetical protein
MVEHTGEVKSARALLTNDGELIQPDMSGVPAPDLSPLEFSELEEESKEEKRATRPLGRFVRFLRNKTNEDRDPRTTWDPDAPIMRSVYQEEDQEPVTEDEMEEAQDFLKKLHERYMAWSEKMTGKPIGKEEIHELSPHERNPTRYKPDAVRGEAWGFDVLRLILKEKGLDPSLVDSYFKDITIIRTRYFGSATGSSDKCYLADALFRNIQVGTSLAERLGHHEIPQSLSKRSEQFKQFDRNDFPDILAKQYVYFLRYANGTPGESLDEKGKIKGKV